MGVKKRKSHKILFLLIILSLLLLGCQGKAVDSDADLEAVVVNSAPTLIGAIMAPGESPYGYYNDLVREAIQRIGHRQGMQVTIIEAEDFLEKEETIDYFFQNRALYVFVNDPAYYDILSLENREDGTSFVMLFELLRSPSLDEEVEDDQLFPEEREDSLMVEEEGLSYWLEEQMEKIINQDQLIDNIE
ncbi:hypothetical protein F9B85_01180 [Heliorestis acidaminivorans]|uniref:Uncharacterized protein n=1 Tax=Heliorestis acidaminivorans TaxID=553427 RepID=A0A6I0F5T4_9FIRM|nr:hypothetical protein [Heliorestis acidaminivorans]KAB2954332.1 hypothetical protein F9B85_01180 [Heliorestis acidaminivorans]